MLTKEGGNQEDKPLNFQCDCADGNKNESKIVSEKIPLKLYLLKLLKAIFKRA